MQTFTIGKAARAAGMAVDTLRFYERQGLLPAAPRSEGGYRLYSPADVDRLRFIRRAKTLGFSLDEIAELLRLSEDGGDRASVRRVAEHRLADLDRKLAELGALREALATLVQRCSGRGPVQGCPIIEGVLAQGEHPACKESP